MVALVDCNNFFCSVERVFCAGIRNKPVCVAGSNDGIIVALTQEAKALGLKRGDPVFKVKDIVTKNNVKIFSTNMTLYAAMSKRITNILRNSVLRVENYSIDESFCYLDGYERIGNIEDYMREVVKRIALWTDIPVSVGIAPTKTLAKIGSKFAKKYKGYRSVCLIDTEEKRRKALSLFDLADVWGVGRQTLKKLNYYGVYTTIDFSDKKESWVKSHFNLPVLQTWRELNGIPSIDTSEVIQKQSICTSRSFGEMVTDIDSLKSSIVSFASSSANKLRGQGCLAKAITVFITTNRFREDLPQYSNSHTEILSIPTSDTLEIVHAAIGALKKIYLDGMHYKKSGVILSDISKDDCVQQYLFDEITNRPERATLMKVIDNINQRYGVNKIQIVSGSETGQSWHNKSENRSANYLTNIDEILTIKV